MKNRRIAIVAFLLCACMVIGLGYAATVQDLTVTTTASANQGSLDVYFIAAEKGDKCAVAEVDGGTKNFTATMNTENLNKGETATATFEIENQELEADQIAATIAAPTFVGGENSVFSISYRFIAEGNTEVSAEADGNTVTYLAPQGKVKLVVNITLNSEVTEHTTTVVTLKFHAQSTAFKAAG